MFGLSRRRTDGVDEKEHVAFEGNVRLPAPKHLMVCVRGARDASIKEMHATCVREEHARVLFAPDMPSPALREQSCGTHS